MKKLILGIVAVAVVLGGAYAGTHYYLKNQITEYIKRLEKNSPGSHYSFKGFTVNVFEWKGTLYDVIATQDKVGMAMHADELSFKRCDFSNPFPLKCTTSVRGFSPTAQDPKLNEYITNVEKAIGTKLAVNIDFHQDYAPKTNHKFRTTVKIWQAGKANIDLELKMEGVDFFAVKKAVDDMNLQSSLSSEKKSANAMALGFALLSHFSAMKVELLTLNFDSPAILQAVSNVTLQTSFPKPELEGPGKKVAKKVAPVRSAPTEEEVSTPDKRAAIIAELTKLDAVETDPKKKNKYLHKPPMVDFLKDSRMLRVVVKPDPNKTVTQIFSDLMAKSQAGGAPNMYEAMGVQVKLNDQVVDFN